MHNKVLLRDELVSLQGVVHWEERGEWAMMLKEEGSFALYKIWEQLNLGVADDSTWTLGSTCGRSGGQVSDTGCKFWFKPLDALRLNWWDEWRSAEYRSTPPSLLTYGRTISRGGRPPST